MDLRALPKVELHRHLEGAMRFSTVVELAKTRGLQLPYGDIAALKNRLLVTSPMRNLKEVLDKFWMTQSLLDSEEVLERIAYEAVEDAYAEGVRILELRYSLSFVLKNHANLQMEQIHSSFVKGLKRGMKEFPVAAGLISIIGRVDEPATQKRVMDFTVDHKDSFLAVDLADTESAQDFKTLVPLFEKARKAGLHVTIHAGESPGTEQNVVDSIKHLGAERIGHGLQIFKFPDLIEFVKKSGIVLELCPTSNWLTNAVPSTAQHPFRKLMEAGVKVTINSDDPGIFDIDLTREYEILKSEHQFTSAEFKKCGDVAARASFIDPKLIAKHWTF